MNALERNRRNKQATIKLHQQIKLTKASRNSCITENHSFIGYIPRSKIRCFPVACNAFVAITNNNNNMQT